MGTFSIGDEVVFSKIRNNIKGVIISICGDDDDILCIMWSDSGVTRQFDYEVKKTDRHFPQIAEVLKQIK